MVEEDISKNTVIVLVVLTLAVSMVGTWAVLEELSTVGTTEVSVGTPTGQVRMQIVSPSDVPPPTVTNTGGQVALTLAPPQ